MWWNFGRDSRAEHSRWKVFLKQTQIEGSSWSHELRQNKWLPRSIGCLIYPGYQDLCFCRLMPWVLRVLP